VVYFWSNENDEPVHVHIAIGNPVPNATKVWLTKSGGCVVINNRGRIPQSDLAELQELIRGNHALICDKWKEYFYVDKISFYC